MNGNSQCALCSRPLYSGMAYRVCIEYDRANHETRHYVPLLALRVCRRCADEVVSDVDAKQRAAS